MLLCDSAQAVDGKLYILGGGWSLTGPQPAPSAIAIKLLVDVPDGQVERHWELFLEDEDGQPVMIDTGQGLQAIEVRGEFTAQRPPELPPGTPVDINFAFNFPPFPLQPGRRFTWRLTVDGETPEGAVIAFNTRNLAPQG